MDRDNDNDDFDTDHPRVGYDEDDAECAEYQPSRHELQQVTRYWAGVRLDIALWHFYYGETDSRDRQRASYAAYRLERLAKVLGDDEVRRVVIEIEAKERMRMGETDWRIFTSGPCAERAEVEEETYRSAKYLRRKQEDAATQATAFAHLRENPRAYYIDEAGDLWSLAESCDVKDRQEGRLILHVTTARGASAYVPRYTLGRPAHWHPPFGLC